MEGLAAWVRQIILIALLAGVVEMIMPESVSKRYAHLAMGLLVMLSILVPFLGLLKQDVDWEGALGLSGDGMAPAMAQTGIGGATRRFREGQQQLILEVYRERLNSRVEEVSEGVEGVRRAHARVEVDDAVSSPRYGSVAGAEVEVEIDPGRATSPGPVIESVREAVSEVLGVSRSSVSIRSKPVGTEGGTGDDASAEGGEGVGSR